MTRSPPLKYQRSVIMNSANALYFNMNTIKYSSNLLHGDNLVEFHTCLQQFIIHSKYLTNSSCPKYINKNCISIICYHYYNQEQARTGTALSCVLLHI